MKLGVSIWSFHVPLSAKRQTLEEVMKITAKLGLQGLELEDSCGFEETFPCVPSERRIQELKETADSLGIEIPALSAMGGSFLGLHTGRQVAYVRRWLDLAHSIGTKIVKMNIGSKSREMTNEQAFEQAKNCVKKCLRLAQKYDITLAPELWPVDSYPSGDVAAMITMMKTIDSKYFRHTVDNDLLDPGWAVAAYRLLAPYTVNVHASIYEDTYMSETDKGKFEFGKFVSILKSVGYDGYLMIEWRGHNTTVQECVRGLEKSAMALRRWMAS